MIYGRKPHLLFVTHYDTMYMKTNILKKAGGENGIMLQYSGYPKFRKKSELLGNNPICLDRIVCDTVLPNENFSGLLFSNEVYEVDLITEGNGICQVFGQSVPCKEGDIFVIPPDIPHGCFVSESKESLHISRLFFDINDWFSPEVTDTSGELFCYGTFCKGSLIAYATLNSSLYDAVKGFLDNIQDEIQNARIHWKTAVQSHLTVLFVSLGRYIGEEDRVSVNALGEWHYAGVAVRMIMENFCNKDLKLETLADTFHVSKSHFSRLFKGFTGESFSDYLRTVRLNNACKLLKDTKMTIEQIVDACGMRDTRTFCKNFNDFIGVTPSAYRNEKKQTNSKGEKIMAILNEISEKLQQGRAKVVAELVKQAIDEGCEPERILNEGLLSAMDIIGQKFRNNEIFVPEVLIAARAMNMGSQVLKPYLVSEGITATGKACIGTVQGDLHDIGKNLVKMMLEGKGIEVIDLGVDVPAEKFIQTAIDEKCDLICCSALLTTTMNVMEQVVKAADEAGIRDKVKIMVGGAPVSEEFSKQIGADVYTSDAADAANVALELCTAARS